MATRIVKLKSVVWINGKPVDSVQWVSRADKKPTSIGRAARFTGAQLAELRKIFKDRPLQRPKRTRPSYLKPSKGMRGSKPE